MNRAYFIAQASDAHLDDAERTEKFGDVGLVVCNPSMDPADLKLLRESCLPDAKLLAYENTIAWQAVDFQGEYWVKKHNRVDPELIDLGTFNNHPTYKLNANVALELADFHGNVTLRRGFDGIYIDQCWAKIPEHRLRLLRNVIGPKKTKEFHLDWIEGKLLLTRLLRDELGEDGILIGNTGGALCDPTMNGITLEGVGDRFPTVIALAMFVNHQKRNPCEPINVAWKTTQKSVEPSNALGAIPWIYSGTLSYVDLVE